MTPHLNWWSNISIWAGVAGWVFAEVAKLLIHIRKTGRFDSAFLFRLGGMPSSHSAAVSALFTSVGIREGLDSSAFAVALGFAIIVMIDAQTVRRAAGQQARLLNQIMDEFVKEHRFPHKKLTELLGHTRLEVLLGMVMGIVTGLLVHSIAAY